MKNLFSILAIGILLFLFMQYSGISCTQKFIDGSEWGLKSVEYKQPMQLKGEECETIFSYRSRFSSKRYELRLYFPYNNTFRNDSLFNIQQDKLSKDLNGLEAEIIDQSTHKVLHKMVISSKKDMSFNRSPEISLCMWVFSGVSFEKGTTYKIKIKTPPVKEFKKEFHDIIIILGVGSTPML